MPAADSPPAAPALVCRLKAEPPLAAGGPVAVRLTLENPGTAPLYFLRWNTPFEGWEGTVFEVISPEGAALRYRGPLVKRGDPEREEYVELPAGGAVSAAADLAEVYDLVAPGRYRVRVPGALVDATADAASLPRPRDAHRSVPLACGELTVDVAPR
ncbi:MAG TPA: hypothetical protein VNJ70_20435 [Thermoanaerobaculia bacterium]|nr:hypothetical protein [Thermoanaerobaculia bacterium]